MTFIYALFKRFIACFEVCSIWFRSSPQQELCLKETSLYSKQSAASGFTPPSQQHPGREDEHGSHISTASSPPLFMTAAGRNGAVREGQEPPGKRRTSAREMQAGRQYEGDATRQPSIQPEHHLHLAQQDDRALHLKTLLGL
ncbi:hypothetical protein E2320_022620, partial [Naja naja]